MPQYSAVRPADHAAQLDSGRTTPIAAGVIAYVRPAQAAERRVKVAAADCDALRSVITLVFADLFTIPSRRFPAGRSGGEVKSKPEPHFAVRVVRLQSQPLGRNCSGRSAVLQRDA